MDISEMMAGCSCGQPNCSFRACRMLSEEKREERKLRKNQARSMRREKTHRCGRCGKLMPKWYKFDFCCDVEELYPSADSLLDSFPED